MLRLVVHIFSDIHMKVVKAAPEGIYIYAGVARGSDIHRYDTSEPIP